MVVFEDVEESGRLYLNTALNSQAMQDGVKQTFPVFPSMLRPITYSNPDAMQEIYSAVLTPHLNTDSKSGPAYLLRSVLKETKSTDTRLPMLGRRISKGIVRWGSTNLKVSGDFSFIPLYWEWTEDVLARFSDRLRKANIYHAVHASLYLYDREPNIVRAFCESWCPTTNTLHTTVGEWSISLWDLHELGGLPIVGRRYDEAVPSFKSMTDKEDKLRSTPGACEYLFRAYCFLASLPESKDGVRITQWIKYWCKCEAVYSKPKVREVIRRSDVRPKSSRDPRGEIPEKPLIWTSEEKAFFKDLGLADHPERKTIHLGAHLSTWLSGFLLPEGEDPVIRPGTFEVAVCMAKGLTFSLATPVLASIYHGLNVMVNADKPSCSGSMFPSHYLYGWMAHYFDTHHVIDDDIPSRPLMIRYSGSRSAKFFSPVDARNVIHDGSSFKASSLVLQGNRCGPLCDENLEDYKLGYMISLRTGYLPLRSNASFYLEPYHPTRFCRQFGFYQDVPGILPRDPDDGYVTYDTALRSLRLLLFRGSRSTMMIPGRLLNWPDKTTPAFKHWWANVTVSDLRESISVLTSSVDHKKKSKAVLDTSSKKVPKVDAFKLASLENHFPGKRSRDDVEEDEDVNYKHRRTYEVPRTKEPLRLVNPDDAPDFGRERASKALSDSMIIPAEERNVRGRERTGTSLSQENQHVADLHSSSNGPTSGRASSTGVISLHPSSSPTVKMNDELIRVLLTNLVAASPDQVENLAAQIILYFGTIQDSSGDISIIQAAVEAYVKSVVKLRALEQEVVVNADQYTREISEVEADLHSALMTYKNAVLSSQSLEKQEGVVATAIVDTETKLQTLRDEAESIKGLRMQQAGIVTFAKSDVDKLQHEMDGLKTCQASSNDLTLAQSELDERKEAIKAFMP